jgi:hypothetical protein
MVEVVSVGGAEVWLSLFVTTTATVSSVDSGSPCHWVFWTDAFQMLPPPVYDPTVPPHCFLALFLVSIETEAPVVKFVPVTVPVLVPVFVEFGASAQASRPVTTLPCTSVRRYWRPW